MLEAAYFFGGALISKGWKVNSKLGIFVTLIVLIMWGFFYITTYPHFSLFSIIFGIVAGAIV